MVRLWVIGILFLCLGVAHAQEVSILTDSIPVPIAADSLQTDSLSVDTIPALAVDTSAILTDDKFEAEPEVVEPVQFEDTYANRAMLRSLRKIYPLVSNPKQFYWELGDVSSDEDLVAALGVDTIPFDESLSYAQLDLRMPIIYDAQVLSYWQPSIGEMANREETIDEALGLPIVNPFRRQLNYGALRQLAVNNYAGRHLDKVMQIRLESVSHLPFERRTIERRSLERSDQIATSVGLNLDNVKLNFEPVVFHADRWHRTGTTSLQVAQTALSDNWYKGGENNMTISTYDQVKFSRYDESKKTTLEIALELKLSSYYTTADTVNQLRVNDNQFRLDVAYGYKAWKSWYYSTSFYAKTPIFDYHNANSKITKSTFFSPLEMNLSVGLDFKPSFKSGKLNYNLMLAPLAYNLTAVCSPRVSVTSYGIEADRKSLHEFGSTVTSKLEWRITPDLKWTSRFYYFTTYHKVQMEFENTFNYQVSHHCSAKFYYYPRFDDSRDTRLETMEMLTFGLSLMW